MPTSDTSPEKEEQQVDDGLKPKSVVEKIAQASSGEAEAHENNIGAAMVSFQDKGSEPKEATQDGFKDGGGQNGSEEVNKEEVQQIELYGSEDDQVHLEDLKDLVLTPTKVAASNENSNQKQDVQKQQTSQAP